MKNPRQTSTEDKTQREVNLKCNIIKNEWYVRDFTLLCITEDMQATNLYTAVTAEVRAKYGADF